MPYGQQHDPYHGTANRYQNRPRPLGAAPGTLSELDPDDEDLAFGLCDLGLGEPELGYVRLSELANARGPLRLRVERDLHFEADKPISAYAAEAHEHRRIRA